MNVYSKVKNIIGKFIFRNKDTFLGVVLLVFCLFVFYLIANFEAALTGYDTLGPSLFPNLITGFILLLSLVSIYKGLKSPPHKIQIINIKDTKTVKAIIFLGMIVFSARFFRRLGFLGVLFIITIVGPLILGEKRISRILIYSLASVAAIYFIFGIIFGLYLPRGIIENLIGL